MKNNYTQIGIVALSTFLLTGMFVLFAKGAVQFGETDLLMSQTPTESRTPAPVNFDTRISKGDSLMNSEYYSLAASEYSFAINLKPDSAEAYLKLGKAYMALNEYGKSIEEFKKASELDSLNLIYMSMYGEALIKNGQFKEAQSVFDGFTKETQEGKYFAALLDSYSGRFDDAKKKLEKARSLSGTIPATYINRITNAYAVQDGQTVYLKALLTQAFIDVKQFQLAKGLALDILGAKSDYRDVWIMLGYAQLKTESYTDAEESFKQAKKLDAIKPETHYFLGVALYFEKKYEEAVNEFELAVLYGFKPENEAYRKIAESQLFLEKYEESLEAYEHLVKIDIGNVDVFVRPIWIAITYIKDLDRALSLAELAVGTFPNEAMSHNLMAWVYIEKNDLDAADKEIKNAFSVDPNFAEAHYNAGRLREKQGNIDGAKWEYKKAYELSQSGDSISALASERYNALIQGNE